MTPADEAVGLSGDPFARGLQQATRCPAMAEAVRRAVRDRLAAAAWLARPDIRDYLAQQRRFTAAADPAAAGEVAGIAQGFGLGRDELLDYLHLGVAADLALVAAPAADGCTAWAVQHPVHAAMVVKNRDFRGEHQALQRLFRHSDPAWGGRTVLCLGSLGAPGAYSSGINSDGLALVDTQIATDDHGVGLLRYFLMTRILAECATVEEAVALVRRTSHAGGGSLVLGDAHGAVAAVELGHAVAAIERPLAGPVSRTNHFTAPELAGRSLDPRSDPMARSSRARLGRLRDWLAERPGPGPAEAAELMAGHARESGDDAFCRHGEDGDARTISTAIYLTGERRALVAPTRPCAGRWQEVAA